MSNLKDIKGAIFDFRNAVLPVEFSAINPAAMNYFEGMGATPQTPKFTKIWGNQVSEQIVRTITEESAFGAPSVREVKNTRKDFVITGASKETYMWDEEGVLTAAEVAEMVAARETYLATMKQRQEEYKAQKAAEAATPAAPAAGGFHF
jgi:molecular chaperone DnaK (HSP70)